MSSQEIAGNPHQGTVNVTWKQEIGNYDLSYYTVQLLQDNAETQSTVVSAESNSLIAVFSVPFNVNVSARITVTSKCAQTSTGVSTNTIRLTQPPTTTSLTDFQRGKLVLVCIGLLQAHVCGRLIANYNIISPQILRIRMTSCKMLLCTLRYS